MSGRREPFRARTQRVVISIRRESCSASPGLSLVHAESDPDRKQGRLLTGIRDENLDIPKQDVAVMVLQCNQPSAFLSPVAFLEVALGE